MARVILLDGPAAGKDVKFVGKLPALFRVDKPLTPEEYHYYLHDAPVTEFPPRLEYVLVEQGGSAGIYQYKREVQW